MPLWEGGRFKELCKLKGFKAWDLLGISTIGDIMECGEVKSWPILSQEYGLHRCQFIRYAQLRHALQAENIQCTDLPEYAPLEGRLLQEELVKKAVSLMYKTINNNMPDRLGGLRARWEKDDGPLEDRLGGSLNAPQRARLCFVHYKILHRIYYDNAKLHKMGRSETLYCFTYKGVKGDFFHTIWTCPTIHAYWEAIISVLGTILGVSLPVSPGFVLLGIPSEVDINRAQLLFASLGLAVAKRDVAR